MIRSEQFGLITFLGIPRESGDDPVLRVSLVLRVQYSPRERG